MKRLFYAFIVMVIAIGWKTTAFAGQGWPANYNGVMLQGFYWDSYDDSKWITLTNRANELSKYFDLIWIPQAGTETTVSAYESTTQSMGYDPIYYFKYNTIFGSEEQLRTMINTYKAKGTGIIEDVVINHKRGETGWCDFANETVVGQNTGKTYTVTWDNTTFSGICRNDEANYSADSEGYGLLSGADDTGDNFDGYRDLDHTNTTVQQNMITYQDYLLNELGFAGFRLDMVKGYSGIYTKMYNEAVNPKFSVGEYWDSKDNITNWIKTTNYTSAAFDFPLHTMLKEVLDNNNWNALSDKSFTADPNMNRYSVTFVDNHDTFRNTSDKVNNSWSAANAFILAMPGTPCIFLPHYTADPTNIQAMITARKACGVTNQSCIITQEMYSTGYGYTIETQGTNGKVLLLLGDAAKYDSSNHDGYSLVASSNEWTDYKFYATKTTIDPEVVFSTEGCTFTSNTIEVMMTPNSTATTAKYKIGDGSWNSITEATTITLGEELNDGESVIICWEANDGTTTKSGSYTFTKETPKFVYFNNTGDWSNVYAYTWNSTTGEYAKGWPGTKLTETTAEGYYKFKVEDASDMIIFNDGNNNKTSDNKIIGGYVYNSSETVVTGYRVYFSNASNWTTVNCYSWDGDTRYSGDWPGNAMTYDSNTGYYFIDFAGEPSSLIFNNGNSGTGNQSGDLDFHNGYLYSYDGSSAGSSVAYETILPSTSTMTIVDGVSYTATEDIVAGKVTYSRTCSNAWGTLCLPFAYSSNNKVQYYTIKSNTASSVVVSPIVDVQAGQPVIFNILSAIGSNNKYNLSVTVSDAIVRSKDYGKTVSPVSGWTINGAYDDKSILNDGSIYKYYIANNQFWYATETATIPTYRAWLEGPAPANGAKSMSIEVYNNSSSTAINSIINEEVTKNEIFNLQGQRLVVAKKGINIINGKKVLVK